MKGHLLGPSPVRNLSNVRAGNRRCKLQRNLQTDATVRAVRAEINNNTETYIKRSTDGRLVYSAVEKAGGKRIVTIGVEKIDVPSGDPPQLIWGFYRSSKGKWYHPDGCAPAGSALSKTVGVMKSPMHLNRKGSHFETKVQVPGNLEPVMLGCSIVLPGPTEQTLPSETEHMCIPIGMGKGSPSHLGTSILRNVQDSSAEMSSTVNFAVVSRNAASLTLFLVRNSGPDNIGKGHLEIVLDPTNNRTGDVWHIAVEGLKDLGSLCYGWRAEGALGSENEGDFDSSLILLDPYARTVTSLTLPEAAGPGSGNFSNGSQGSLSLLGCLSHLVEPHFSWSGSPRRRLAIESLITCTMDLQTMQLELGALLHARSVCNTTEAAVEMLDQAEDIGCNTILLKGAGDPNNGAGALSPMHSFGPDSSLASNGQSQQAHSEFKQFVRGCHEKGMEVLLEVDFTSSSEINESHPHTLSLKRMDRALYFRNGRLNWGHPVIRQAVLDSLRNWVQCFQVDGFVFLNAECMAQDRDGIVVDNPPLPESIVHDPLLRQYKMIAVSGNDALLPRSGERGCPHWGTWLEWNKRFQQDVWEYIVNGQDDKLSAMATRITGSTDLFAARLDADLPGCLAAGRRPSFGLNSAVPFCHSLSSAFAGDMTSSSPQIKCLLVASLVFQGIPSLPIDCLSDKLLQSLVKSLTRIRSQYKDLIAPADFTSLRSFEWHGTTRGAQPMWDGGGIGSNYIGYSIRPDPSATRGIYVGFNPHVYNLSVDLPEAGDSTSWRCLVDTMDDSITTDLTSYIIKPKTAVVFDLV